MSSYDDDFQEQFDEPKYINTLLDVENFAGLSESRLTPWLLTLTIGGAPFLLVPYLLGKLPFIPMMIACTLWAIRWSLIILGEEKKRVKQFKKQVYDVYSTSYDLLNIRTIHEDGCIEYINGRVCYMVVADNGNQQSAIEKAQYVKNYLVQVGTDFVPDIYVQNITAGDILRERYAGVKFFEDTEVKSDFIDIMDENIHIANNDSLLVKLIFLFKGDKKEYKIMKDMIEASLNSDDARIFKSLQLCDKSKVEDIISRDLDTYIDYEELMRNKYSKGKYYGSKVLEFDYGEDEIDEKREVDSYEIMSKIIDRGFLVKDD